MRSRVLIVISIVVCWLAPVSRGALVLATLSNPTVDTLIGLGSDGVTVGPLRFYDFTYASSPVASTPAASAVAVVGNTTGGDGLRFVSAWAASFGSSVTDLITYKVATTDGSSISSISLFSDGTAPVAGAGTFASSTMTARTSLGAVVGRILSTFDDGVISPVDTSHADVDSDAVSFVGQPFLAVTDAITVDSGVSPPGVAIASTVENTFDAVSVPGPVSGMFFPVVVAFLTLNRRSRRLWGRENASQARPLNNTLCA